MIWIAIINSNLIKGEKMEIRAKGMKELTLKINKETNLNIKQNTLHNIYWNRAGNWAKQINAAKLREQPPKGLVTVAKATPADGALVA